MKEAKETTIYIIVDNQIEETNLYDFVMLSQDETTSPRGVAPRIFYEKGEEIKYRNLADKSEVIDEFDYEDLDSDDKKLYQIETEVWYEMRTWGYTGNKNQSLGYRFDTEAEAQNFIYERVYYNDFQGECNRRTDYYHTYEDCHEKLIEELSENWKCSEETAKHVFRKEQTIKELRTAKKEVLIRDLEKSKVLSKDMLIIRIVEDKEVIKEALKELDQLKENNEKEIWQVKANALIQKVSNNDFRFMKWKEIYNLIKEVISLNENINN